MDDERTTVSWKVIEPGWSVYSTEGDRIGAVHAVVGDRDADIFNGLAITEHGGPSFVHEITDRPRYVAAERVAAIQEGAVRLSLTRDEAGRLPEHEAADAVEILPEDASLIDRIEKRIEGDPDGRGSS